MDESVYGLSASQAWEASVRPRLEKGVSYRHCGRDPDTGLDCVGLLIWAYRTCGFDIREPKETGNYPPHFWRKASPVLLLPALRPYASTIEAAHMVGGDILVFNSGSRPAHVGIMDGTDFWHVTDDEGLLKESIVRSKWTRHLRCVMRIHAVTGVVPPPVVTADLESALKAQKTWRW